MRYTIIDEQTDLSAEIALDALQHQVNHMVFEGWLPSGGVSVTYVMPHDAPNYWVVAQAMTKAAE